MVVIFRNLRREKEREITIGRRHFFSRPIHGERRIAISCKLLRPYGCIRMSAGRGIPQDQCANKDELRVRVRWLARLRGPLLCALIDERRWQLAISFAVPVAYFPFLISCSLLPRACKYSMRECNGSRFTSPTRERYRSLSVACSSRRRTADTMSQVPASNGPVFVASERQKG